MKKLLSILASVTLVASSSSAVVACCDNYVENAADSYINNNLNNILGASLEKAKSVIINNEYGIDQSVISNSQSSLKVSGEGLSGIDYSDLNHSKNSSVSDLISQYYGNITNNNSNTDGGNSVDLGGTNGVTSTIDYFLQQAMDALKVSPIIQNAIFRNKDAIIGFLKTTQDTVNMTTLNNINTSMYNQSISGQEYLPNQVIKMGINFLQTQILKEGTSGTWHTVANAILSVVDAKDTFSDQTLPGLFADTGTMHLIRQTMKDLLTKGTTQSVIQDSVYQNTAFSLPDYSDGTKPDLTFTPDATVVKLADVSVKDIKKEFLASLDRIAKLVLSDKVLKAAGIPSGNKKTELDATTNPYETSIDELENIISTVVSGLVSGALASSDLFTSDFSEDKIMGLVWDGLRDVCLMNAQFSMFEDTYTNRPVDSEHLFNVKDDSGKEMTNYQYLNSLADKKISDLDYLHGPDKATVANDEPINLNYFLANLNYYLGGLQNKDDDGVYRFQKLLFILFSDPIDPVQIGPDGKTHVTTGDDIWTDKQSDLLDFVVNTGLKIGLNIVGTKAKADPDNSTYQIILKLLNELNDDPADVTDIENMILKPVILGLINGNSFQNIVEVIDGALRGATGIPEVAQLLQGLQAYGINIDDIIKALDRLVDEGMAKDTIHDLFVKDFRNIVKPLSFIPQEWMDKLFGPDKPVNLLTIVNMPLSKILSILGVSGFEGGKVSPIGDYFTMHSIPWLVSFLNNFLNGMNGYIPQKYISLDKDGNVDYTKSLKARDIDFRSIYDLFISIVGENGKPTYQGDGKDNILSELMHDLVETDDSEVKGSDGKNDLTKFNKLKITLDPSKATKDLGLVGQQEKQTSDSTPDKPKTLFGNQFDDGDSDPVLGNGLYDDGSNTITFKDAKNITSSVIPGETPTDDSGAISIEGLDPSETIGGASFGATGLTINLKKSLEQASAYTITVKYIPPKGKGSTATQTVDIPALYKNGVDVQIQKDSLAGSFYRLNLPMIDKDSQLKYTDGTKTAFIMNDKYLQVDLLHQNYSNVVNLLDYFNTPAYYGEFVDQILSNQRAFEFKYDPRSIKYFQSDPDLIKELTFAVTFRNYTVGTTNKYIFTVSRDSNISAFKITQLVTDKTD